MNANFKIPRTDSGVVSIDGELCEAVDVLGISIEVGAVVLGDCAPDDGQFPFFNLSQTKPIC